ncbi:hypothetical protein DF122_22740 [Burkholderia pseudomallei]|nr:hypothetical protein BOC35_31890 [Burkholderia pseudomallei]ARK52548.1 hypothetical protein BOC36_04800 [Burkholderia pseudomallei]ARK63539.1 hypothetical protein BOC37_27935 [Burkholderia pseudomallei]ARK68153.1 hypothetical protein BOC38_16605 [Burkholderia pseudomallei]ARK81555.1 hypothetical protein BOC40_15000 [Burkholderia pseudomallei]
MSVAFSSGAGKRRISPGVGAAGPRDCRTTPNRRRLAADSADHRCRARRRLRRAPRRSTRERLRASAAGPRAGGAELTNDCEERRTS